MTTITFSYWVGKQALDAEADFDGWENMNPGEREDALLEAAKEDVQDLVRVNIDSVEEDDEDDEDEDNE